MQKKMIALAVAAALAAPAAMAETTVYGIAHLDFGNLNDGANSQMAVTSNSSRFGIKGGEDLDDGMKAIYQIEFGVDMSSGNGVTARNQFVGLSGGFGTILLGRHDAPIKVSTGKLDIFTDTIADYNNVVGINGALDVRPGNVIAYATPNMGGINALVAYVPDENKGNAIDEQDVSASITYEGGPLFLAVGYIDAKAETTANLTGFAHTLAPAAVDATSTRVGLGYALSDATKFALVYDTAEIGAAGGGAKTKVVDYYANVAQKLGNNTLKLAFGVIDPDGADNNSTFMAVGASHNFTKNTEAYVIWASMSNDPAAAAYLGAGPGPGHNIAPGAGLGGVTPVAGQDPSAVVIGMIHKF